MKKLLLAFAAGGVVCATYVVSALLFRVQVPRPILFPDGGPVIVPGPFFIGSDSVLLMVIAGLLATSAGLGVALLRSRRGAELETRQIDPQVNSRLSDARLERIEQAIEAMAVEIERIGEMERSAARILAARPLEGEHKVITPRPYPARVITPH